MSSKRTAILREGVAMFGASLVKALVNAGDNFLGHHPSCPIIFGVHHSNLVLFACDIRARKETALKVVGRSETSEA